MPGLQGASFNLSQGNQYGQNWSYGYNQADASGSSNASNQAQGTSVSGQDPRLLQMAQQSYADTMQQHQNIYRDVMNGYRDALGRTGNAADRIAGGYQGLNSQIQSRIAGSFAPQRQAIEDQYAQQQGSAHQGLTSRGLGNTTVRDSVDRGLLYDKTKAQASLAGQEAQMGAGYDWQTGQGGMQAYQQAMGIGGQLAGQNMGVIGSQNMPFIGFGPNASQSQNTATGQSQSQNQSHSQGEQWGYGMNFGQNFGYGQSGQQQGNHAAPTQYYPGGYGGYGDGSMNGNVGQPGADTGQFYYQPVSSGSGQQTSNSGGSGGGGSYSGPSAYYTDAQGNPVAGTGNNMGNQQSNSQGNAMGNGYPWSPPGIYGPGTQGYYGAGSVYGNYGQGGAGYGSPY